MRPKFIQWLTAMALSCLAASALATITCSSAPASTGFSTAYSSTGVVPNVIQGGDVTFTCTRSLAGDPTSINLVANNGLNPSGNINGAAFGGSTIQYEGYQDSACSVIWTRNGNGSAIPVPLLSVLTPQTITKQWWGCITTAGQAPAAGAGTYMDTVTMTLRSSPGNTVLAGASTGAFTVNIIYPASCIITSVANVVFGTYVAFRNTALVSPAANVVMNCTSRLPYTMALDATSGVVVGLNYSLATSWVAGSQLRGTGPGQTYTITGTMPASQAGQCTTSSCTGSNIHTLTVTY